jgi:hypothetical protein
MSELENELIQIQAELRTCKHQRDALKLSLAAVASEVLGGDSATKNATAEVCLTKYTNCVVFVPDLGVVYVHSLNQPRTTFGVRHPQTTQISIH